MNKRLAIVIIIFLSIVLGFTILAFADPTDRSTEYILNRVFDSSTNTLRVQ